MNLNKLFMFGVIAASASVLSACSLPGYSSSNSTSSVAQKTQSQTNSQVSQGNSPAQAAVTITYSNSGFSPAIASVKSGGKITWVNSSNSQIQVASDPHPAHTDNPELTGGQFVISLAPGASATVTVTKVGTWGYHNHLNPGTRGKVMVE